MARKPALKKPKVKKKKINLYTAVKNYIFLNQALPPESEYTQSQLTSVLTFYFEQLYNFPNIQIILNKYFNRKEENLMYFTPMEKLDYLKLIVKSHNVKPYQLYNFFPKRDYANGIKSLLANIPEIETPNDAKNFWFLMKKLDATYLDKIINQYGKVEITAEEKEEIKEAYEAFKEYSTQEPVEESTVNVPENTQSEQPENDFYIKEITQEVIDEEQLTLFDIRLLKQSNMFLFIFIDKYNRKRYHKRPFYAEFYIHKDKGILNNDYIEDFNPDRFIQYMVNNHKDLNQLKYMLQKNYIKNLHFKI